MDINPSSWGAAVGEGFGMEDESVEPRLAHAAIRMARKLYHGYREYDRMVYKRPFDSCVSTIEDCVLVTIGYQRRDGSVKCIKRYQFRRSDIA